MKKASLTVLGGPLAGAHAELPDDGVVTVGSDPDCTLRLDTPNVRPLHARLVLEGGRATVVSTGAEPPVHVNDNPLGPQSATLRNGDILWLGVPGGDDTVMLQCILPPPPAPVAGSAVSSGDSAAPTPHVETQALWAGSPRTQPPLEPPPTPARRTGREPTLAIDPDELQKSSPPTPPPEGQNEPLIIAFDELAPDEGADDEAVVVEEPELVTVDDITPVDLGDGDEAVIVDEDEFLPGATPTFVSPAPDPSSPPTEAPSAPAPKAPTPQAEIPPGPSPSPPTQAEIPAPPTPKPRPAVPPAPRTPRTAPPARVAAPPSARASARRPAVPSPPPPPPEELLENDEDELEGEEPPTRSALLALAGFAGVLILGLIGWAVWSFVIARPSPAPTPTPVAATSLPPPPAATPQPPPRQAPPNAAQPTPTPAPTAAPTPVAAPSEAQPTPPPRPAPTPTPTPPPARPAAAPPPQPSPGELQAQRTAERIDALLAQADAALASRRYDAAIQHADEVLRLDATNARAQATRTRAVTLQTQANRRFVASRTRVLTAREENASLAGFDTGGTDLREAPDFQGRIEFEMTPPTGIQGGDPWTLRIFVVNGGEKPIHVQGVDTVTQVNGAGSGGAIPPRTRQVPTQQRVLVGELSGTWEADTNAWSTQVTVTANKSQSLRATLTWR